VDHFSALRWITFIALRPLKKNAQTTLTHSRRLHNHQPADEAAAIINIRRDIPSASRSVHSASPARRAILLTMTEKEDLFETLQSNPDDLEAWQVYGDQLLQEGDARGEMIAIDLALRNEPAFPTAQRLELVRRRERLIAAHRSEWLSNIAALSKLECRWEFGYLKKIFVGRKIAATLSALQKNDLLPFPFSLAFSSRDWGFSKPPAAAAARTLAKSSALTNLECLDISTGGNLRDAGAEALANSTAFPKLKRLNLGGNRLGLPGVEALANAPGLANLELLDLSVNSLEDAAIEALAKGTGLPNLETLILNQNIIRDAGVCALADSPLSTRLKALELDRCYFGAAGAVALANSPGLGKLERLSLAQDLIGDAGAEALAKSAALGNLRTLNLSSNRLNAPGADALANSESLTQLEILDLGWNEIGDAGAIALALSPAMRELTTAKLSRNNIGVAGVDALVEHLTQLEELELSYNTFGVAGARSLASARLTKLTMLSIAGCDLGDAGAEALANSELTLLRRLDLVANGISDAGARTLANAQVLRNLVSLSLSENPIGLAGAKALNESEALANLQSLPVHLPDLDTAQHRDLEQRFLAKRGLEEYACHGDLFGLRVAKRQSADG
jgi:Ran GTPase-activating protein (RanGAP) involved in mRNA processing and transport